MSKKEKKKKRFYETVAFGSSESIRSLEFQNSNPTRNSSVNIIKQVLFKLKEQLIRQYDFI